MRSLYDSILMEPFLDGFKFFMDKENYIGNEQLCSYFVKSEIKNEKHWNYLRRYCKNLVLNDSHVIILKFMFGVFINGNSFDVKRFADIFSKISICDNYSLKDLGTDCFKKYKELSRIEMDETEVFNDDPFEIECDDCSISYEHIYGAILILLCEKLYGRRISLDNLTKDDIDRCIERDNPNTQYPFLIYTSVVYDWELFDYTLEKYMLPAYIRINWNNTYSVDNRLKMILFDSCINYIIDRLSVKLFSLGIYSSDEMLKDIADEKSPDFANIKKFFENRQTLSVLLKQLYEKSRYYSYSKNRYNLCLATICALYYSGQYEDTIKFLVNYYNDLSINGKNNKFVNLILIKSINNCKSYDEASILFGYYTYEAEIVSREYHLHVNDIKEMIDFLNRVKTYVVENNEEYVDEIFGNGKIDLTVNEVEKMIESDVLSYDTKLIDKLYSIVVSFANNEDYNPPWKKYDPHNTLYAPVSFELKEEALCYRQYEFNDRLYYFLNCVDFYKVKKTISYSLQNRLNELLEENIFEKINELSSIRNNYKSLIADSDDIESDSGNSEKNESDINKILVEIDNVIENLNRRIALSGSNRSFYEKKIYAFHDSFIKDNNLESKDLLSVFPYSTKEEIINYCISSELVFDVLKYREDSNKLDFSPAIISLTKALEKTLNYIYGRMDVVDSSSLDNDTKKIYFFKGTRKNSVEIGPCARLLCDYKNIGITKDSNEKIVLSLNDPESFSKFNIWNGDRVIDVHKLSSYKNIDFPVRRTNDGTIYANMIDGDDVYNRHILFKALFYIKNNYRNPVAHAQIIGMNKAKECREFLLDTHNILWVLISIIKPDQSN